MGEAVDSFDVCRCPGAAGFIHLDKADELAQSRNSAQVAEPLAIAGRIILSFYKQRDCVRLLKMTQPCFGKQCEDLGSVP